MWQAYGGSNQAEGKVKLIEDRSVRLGGRWFFPDQEYDADDRMVLAHRKLFHVCGVIADVPRERLGDPEE